jgi:hypothetical protein
VGTGGRRPGVRTMFFAYLTLTVAGLVYFTVIGLTHH